MLAEARQAMLLQRVQNGPAAMSARQALELATIGGAKVLNRKDIGALKPNMAADLVAFDLRELSFAGALHDPVAALIFAQPAKVSWSIINGKVVVREGELQTVDTRNLAAKHNRLAAQLVNG
jgi:8-oxoguanine deaminase